MKNIITTIILSLFTIGMLYSQSCDRELSSLEPNDTNNDNWIVPSDGVTCVSTDLTVNRLEISDGGTLLIAEGATLTIAQGVFPNQIPDRNSTVEVHGKLKFNQATVIPMSIDLTVLENGELSVSNGNANLSFRGDTVNFLNKGTVAFSVLDLSENSNAYFDNQGTMNVNQNINISGKAEFLNTGNLTIGNSFNNNADSRYINCGVVQTGGFNLQGGEIINTGLFTATGTIEMNEASSLIKNYNTFSANSINLAGATIYNSGEFTLPTITSNGNLEGPDSESNYWGKFTFNGQQNGFNNGNISGQLNLINGNNPTSNSNLFNSSVTVGNSVIFGACASCLVNTDIEECPSSNNPLEGGLAVNDNATTDQDTPVSIDVAANDNGMDEATVSIENQPSNGTVEVNPTTGIVTYWPNEDFNGVDSFTYQICNVTNSAECDTAEVTITVNELPCSVPINGESFEWDYTANDPSPVTQTIQQPAANAGFVIDIWRLDNSFNMEINGVKLATSEIEFQSSGTPAPGINIQFQDGAKYETDTSVIWQMLGTAETPLIRVKIAPNGDVAMFGSKSSNGPLFPLELFNGNAFNNISWNANDDNTVIFTQNVVGITNITGKGYGLNTTNTPEITILTTTDPTCENGESLENGTITMTVTGLEDGVYDFAYDGGVFEAVAVEAGEATVADLAGGVYNNIVIGSGACQSALDVNVELIEPDCDSCLEIFPGGEWNKLFTKAQVNQLPEPIIDTYDPITVAGTNGGMFFDIYRLDNSFDLKINGQAIANQEIQFDSGTPAAPSNNIRFMDGDLYRYDAPPIWKIMGSADKPMLRIEVSKEGEITLYGSKVSGGPLHELVLHNGAALNTLQWNETADNQIEVTQDANGGTILHGKVYGISVCSTGLYEITKTGSFDNTNPAQIGDVITYTIKVENVADEAISDIVVMDPLLGGELTDYVESGANDGVLNIGETWTYTAEYSITSEDIANEGVYNQATVFGKDGNGNAIPTKESYDPTGEPGPDPDCATCTFTQLSGEDACVVRYPIDSEDPFYWHVTGPHKQRISNDGTIMGANGGFIYDIYRLDNSFNMNINGTDLATQEIEFYQSSLTSGINVQFLDGDKHQTDTPNIKNLRGDQENPMLRVMVSADGNVRLFGSKVSYGPLFELELIGGASFNTIPWNQAQENDLTVSQYIHYTTIMDGFGYGVQNNCETFTFEKTGVFNDENSDGQAQVGETITYNFTVHNTGDIALYDPAIYDLVLGGYVSTASIMGDDNNNGILDIDETWIYTADYEITETDIIKGGVYNQAELSANDVNGFPTNTVMSIDPGNTSLDPARPDHTFVKLVGADCIGTIKVNDVDYRAEGNYRDTGESTYHEMQVNASNAGYIFDIYKLDNSFNMNINGTALATQEIEFRSRLTPGINVQFKDGDKYEVDTPGIKSLKGDAENPMLRLIITADGEASLWGSKENYGPLFELELIDGNSFNTLPWNNDDENTIIISQHLLYVTYLEGVGYVVVDQCDEDYIPYRPDGEIGLEDDAAIYTAKYYPNPVKTTLYVEANTQIETIEIYNLLGQRVANLTPNSKDAKIDMEFLQANVYMMKVTFNGKTETYRVVKE